MRADPRMPFPSHPLLDKMWHHYISDVPYAHAFVAAHEVHGKGPFENDHIALRTLARPGEGIAGTAKIFERLGWAARDSYVFPDVHLRAIYLSQPGLPRIFISELDPAAFPADVRAALLRMPAAPPPPDDVKTLWTWFDAPRRAVRADVEQVAPASQYGAWLLAFGRRVNHFTARVDDVAVWQERLWFTGVPMKKEIEGAPGSDLRQTATEAAPVEVKFSDGSTQKMPYAYFEIAERHRGFDGFLGPQARQLFDMTKPG